MDTTIIVVLAIAALIVLGLAAWFFMSRKRSTELRERFGPEYRSVVAQRGERGQAEKELAERQKRVEELSIRALDAGERQQFAGRWTTVQSRFVDDPPGAIREADELIGEVMAARGYPVSDFEQRAADISVNHPNVVKNYRLAHKISVASDRGEAGTEELRQAMVYYRSLFEELLEQEAQPAGASATDRKKQEVRR